MEVEKNPNFPEVNFILNFLKTSPYSYLGSFKFELGGGNIHGDFLRGDIAITRHPNLYFSKGRKMRSCYCRWSAERWEGSLVMNEAVFDTIFATSPKVPSVTPFLPSFCVYFGVFGKRLMHVEYTHISLKNGMFKK